jgi:hypothetical protein
VSGHRPAIFAPAVLGLNVMSISRLTPETKSDQLARGGGRRARRPTLRLRNDVFAFSGDVDVVVVVVVAIRRGGVGDARARAVTRAAAAAFGVIDVYMKARPTRSWRGAHDVARWVSASRATRERRRVWDENSREIAHVSGTCGAQSCEYANPRARSKSIGLRGQR